MGGGRGPCTGPVNLSICSRGENRIRGKKRDVIWEREWGVTKGGVREAEYRNSGAERGRFFVKTNACMFAHNKIDILWIYNTKKPVALSARSLPLWLKKIGSSSELESYRYRHMKEPGATLLGLWCRTRELGLYHPNTSSIAGSMDLVGGFPNTGPIAGSMDLVGGLNGGIKCNGNYAGGIVEAVTAPSVCTHSCSAGSSVLH